MSFVIGDGRQVRILCGLAALIFCLLPAACSPPRNPEAEARATRRAVQEKLRGCLRDSEPENQLRLVIASVSREADATLVRLVAFNAADPPASGKAAPGDKQADNGGIDFDVPNYLMSRGRWLINESGRAYLIDETCREYKLNDRRLLMRQAEAKNGRIRLQPGEACEVLLTFPAMSSEVQEAALVYGNRALFLSLLPPAA